MWSFWVCTFSRLLSLKFKHQSSNKFPHRIDDDTALRAKVEEALNVYDEYMKNKSSDGETVDPTKGKEIFKEGAADETKS